MTKALRSIALLAVLAVSATPTFADEARYLEGDITVAARAGVAPAAFKRKATLSTTVSTVANAFAEEQSKNFNKLHSLPFTAGADIGYVIQDNLELFVNFDYAHACAKKIDFTTKAPNATGVTWKTRPYSSFAAYFGARHYFCQTGDFLPFAGAKLGVRRFASCSKGATVTGHFSPDVTFKRNSLSSCTGFSGGVQFGFDYFVAENYALTFMSEILATTGKRFNSKAEIHRAASAATPLGLQTQVTRNPRAMFSFPITLGLRIKL